MIEGPIPVAIVVLLALSAPIVVWAIVTRPSRERLRDTIYWELSCVGFVAAWLAFNYFVGGTGRLVPMISLIGVLMLCYWAKERFNQ